MSRFHEDRGCNVPSGCLCAKDCLMLRALDVRRSVHPDETQAMEVKMSKKIDKEEMKFCTGYVFGNTMSNSM